MLRVLKTGMLMTLAAAAGFYVPRFIQYPNYAKFEAILPNPTKDYAEEFSIDRGWGCIAVNVAEVFEDKLAGASGKPELAREI